MGFTEIQGDFVLSAFWTFDALFQPQDHPARDQLDTFYLSKPATMPLADEGIVRRVAEAHETGGGDRGQGGGENLGRQGGGRGNPPSPTTAATPREVGRDPGPPPEGV